MKDRIDIQLLFNGNHTSQFAIVDVTNNKILHKGCYIERDYLEDDYEDPYNIIKGVSVALDYIGVKFDIIEEEYIDEFTTNKKELELFKLCKFEEYEEY